MAWYIETSIISKSTGERDWWINEFNPGEVVPVSGIYRCLGCQRETTSNAKDSFPPQNHHQHTPDQGRIIWKLNIRSNTEGK